VSCKNRTNYFNINENAKYKERNVKDLPRKGRVLESVNSD